ncbi:MAG: NifB/NifX family molybdenum-iron cluster-binding protein [Bacillota bacterium]|jgi:predicted Fe-Mo cluster-binding NifX family protein
MIIGIAKHQEFIASRFDCAEEFLIIELQNSQITKQFILQCLDKNLLRKALLMFQSSVNIIICGSIDSFSLRLLEDHKITVISGQHGQLQDFLDRWLKQLGGGS